MDTSADTGDCLCVACIDIGVIGEHVSCWVGACGTVADPPASTAVAVSMTEIGASLTEVTEMPAVSVAVE